MTGEQRNPAVNDLLTTLGGKGEMIKAPVSLHDLRRKIYLKAKSEKAWRFCGLYIHVCKMETLQEAYKMARNAYCTECHENQKIICLKLPLPYYESTLPCPVS
jgi:hypothetical protein